jgi:hypothetical protein
MSKLRGCVQKNHRGYYTGHRVVPHGVPTHGTTKITYPSLLIATLGQCPDQGRRWLPPQLTVVPFRVPRWYQRPAAPIDCDW